MDFIVAATELNTIGKLIYNVVYQWVLTWGNDFTWIGAFGVTVIIFTLMLKIVTSPFDVWQKTLTRKNAKIMEIMKPELDKITKQCGDNRELLMQKQREVYKKYNYSMFSTCLPTVLTLVIFILVFSGFNSSVRHYNSTVFENLQEVYEQTYDDEVAALQDSGLTNIEIKERATQAAEEAVVESYKPESILFTQNIFMPDTWRNPIPTAEDYSGSGIGKLNIPTDATEYEKVMKPIITKYNASGNWNGYLIFPILAFVLNIFSTRLMAGQMQPPQMAGQTAEQKKAQESQQKLMQYMMPVMMAVFALFYSTAFTLYLLSNSAITTIFNLVYNRVAKVKDAKKKEKRLSTTLK